MILTGTPGAVEKVGAYHDLVRTDVITFVPEGSGRIFDFGGGVGATSSALKGMGRADYVVVADQVDESADHVDKRFSGDLEDEGLIKAILAEAGPFDTVLCLDILEHLRDPWKVVKLLAGGLKPGGLFVISIPNVNYGGIILPLLFKGEWKLADSGPLDRTHLRWFTKQTLVEMIEQSGLVLERIEGTIGGKSAVINRATGGLFERFFAGQYIATARAKLA